MSFWMLLYVVLLAGCSNGEGASVNPGNPSMSGTPPQLAGLRSDRTSCQQHDDANPGYLGTYLDPCFGTTMKRIGPNGNFVDHGVPPVTGAYPAYSRADAWNATTSKFLVLGSSGWGHILDGSTYTYIKSPTVGINDQTRWSQTDPDLLYIWQFTNKMEKYNVVSDVLSTVHTWSEYTYVVHGAEGNLSTDGRYMALEGQDGAFATQDVFVYDIQLDSVGTKFNVPGATSNTINWVSMSSSGTYVLIGWNPPENNTRFHGIEVFDRNMNFLRQLSESVNHGDVGIDEDGSDIYVTSGWPSGQPITYNIFYKYTVSTGAYLAAGTFDYLSMTGHHVSMRATTTKGWALISTYDTTYDYLITDAWYPLEQEIYALKLDGNGEVRRIAHHHSFWPIWTRTGPPLPSRARTASFELIRTPSMEDSRLIQNGTLAGIQWKFNETTSSRLLTWDTAGVGFADGDYFAEPHATVNRDFTKVFLGSIWVTIPTITQPASTYHYGYVVDLPIPATGGVTLSMLQRRQQMYN